jgi:3-hydroxy-3-methylglutaryl CoA synthase
LPFGGMGLVAHRAMLRRAGISGKRAALEHFTAKTLASLAYVRRMGGTYGSSTFLGLMGMLASDEEIRAGDRLGVFSYGSGSCAEWWSGRVCAEARDVVRASNLPALLDARRAVSVAEYEAVETARGEVIDSGDYTTDRTLLGDWYAQYYAGKGLLVFDGMGDYYRRYGWS